MRLVERDKEKVLMQHLVVFVLILRRQTPSLDPANAHVRTASSSREVRSDCVGFNIAWHDWVDSELVTLAYQLVPFERASW